MNKTNRKSGGIGFIGLLTLVFLLLKLTNVIHWSWIWVLSPVWISAALFLTASAVILIGGRIKKGKW